jgi:hypothetical protein
MPAQLPAPAEPARGRRGGVVAAAAMTPAQRRERARVAANARWARVADRQEATRTAREASRAEFYAEADAQGVTDPALRERMANNAWAAKMARMRLGQLTSARRRRRAAARARSAAASAARAGEAG